MGHSDTDALMDQEAARVLNTGLRDLWYPVAPSWQVGNAPIGVTRLTERIVLWRDASGNVNALEDRCPHRGARLSLGWNLGDRVPQIADAGIEQSCRFGGVLQIRV